jgi:hypothetical protein
MRAQQRSWAHSTSCLGCWDWTDTAGYGATFPIGASALFDEIHALLKPGGAFVNLRLVASPTPELHELFRGAIGREQDDPTDHLAGLCDQIGWLRDAGFGEADCRFKWLELALIVAVRA